MNDFSKDLSAAQRKAYPFLQLLVEEKRYHNELSKIVIEVLKQGDELDPEKIYDMIHDWRLARRVATDAAEEKVYDLLYEMISAKHGWVYTERENFLRAQASRRRYHRRVT